MMVESEVRKDKINLKNGIADDQKELETFIERHSNGLYSFILSKVKDKGLTEDIFQETFIKVIKAFKMGAYKEEGKFISWAMRIAHNLVIDHVRKSKRIHIYRGYDDFELISVIEDNTLNIEECLIKEQIEVAMKEMIRELPSNQQEVLVMRLYKGMTFKEISEDTGVSINTALGRMHYALANLRKLARKKGLFLR